jgi:acyl carrier protein
MSLTREQVLRRVAGLASETFGCSPESIREDTVADDVTGWDSMSHAIFIMSVEEAFSLEFDVSVVFAFDNVADLVTAIEEKLT